MKKLFLILVLILVVSCKDNGTNTTLGIKPPMNCDTTRRITYNADIKPVIAYYCNCHLDLKYNNNADSAFMYFDFHGIQRTFINGKDDDIRVRIDPRVNWADKFKFQDMGKYLPDSSSSMCFRSILFAWERHGFIEL